MKEETEKLPPIEVPPESLNETTLKAVVDSFIFREGTDYGREEAQHETKSAQILKQISKGHVRIVFDPNTESLTLMTERDWKKTQSLFSATSPAID
jgi:hypothetical protein